MVGDTAVRSETAALQAIARPTEIGAGIAVVILLGALTRYFDPHLPQGAVGTLINRIAKSIEFPVDAIVIGLIGNRVPRNPFSGNGFRPDSAPNSSSRPWWSCSAHRSTYS